MDLFKLKDLIAEIKDGVEIVFVVEDNATYKLGEILRGRGGELPLKIKIKIEEENDKKS